MFAVQPLPLHILLYGTATMTRVCLAGKGTREVLVSSAAILYSLSTPAPRMNFLLRRTIVYLPAHFHFKHHRLARAPAPLHPPLYRRDAAVISLLVIVRWMPSPWRMCTAMPARRNAEPACCLGILAYYLLPPKLADAHAPISSPNPGYTHATTYYL